MKVMPSTTSITHMNSKKAKLLRKLVRQSAAQAELAGNPATDRELFENEAKARQAYDLVNNELVTRKISTGPLKNTPGTQRSMYLTLKKTFKDVNASFEQPEIA